jgi:hypothetical protein
VAGFYHDVMDFLGVSTRQNTLVYSSKDKQGNRQFSDQVPPAVNVQPYKVLSIDPNTNIVPAIEPTTVTTDQETRQDPENDGITALTPYTQPHKIKELISNAKNIEQTLKNRKAKLDKQLEEQ